MRNHYNHDDYNDRIESVRIWLDRMQTEWCRLWPAHSPYLWWHIAKAMPMTTEFTQPTSPCWMAQLLVASNRICLSESRNQSKRRETRFNLCVQANWELLGPPHTHGLSLLSQHSPNTQLALWTSQSEWIGMNRNQLDSSIDSECCVCVRL